MLPRLRRRAGTGAGRDPARRGPAAHPAAGDPADAPPGPEEPTFRIGHTAFRHTNPATASASSTAGSGCGLSVGGWARVERAAVTRNPAALSIPCGCGWPAATSPRAEIRAAGRQRLVDHLQAAGGLSARQIQTLADRALAAAVAQQLAVPGERLAARLIRELAAEALACRQRVLKFDRDLAKLLERHPDAALIRSLPGMGAVLTAEFIAEAGTLAR